MAHAIDYELGTKTTSTITTPATLSTSETDLYIVKDFKYVQASQLSIYGNVTLGSVTSATFNYYFSTDSGTTWFPVCLYNTSTGAMTQRSVLVNSGTYAASSVSYFLDNIPMSSSTAFKVTGLQTTGTACAFNLSVMVRNN